MRDLAELRKEVEKDITNGSGEFPHFCSLDVMMVFKELDKQIEAEKRIAHIAYVLDN